MSGTKENSKANKNDVKQKKEKTVEVLYQKMGDRWFAFSVIDDEMFMGSISQGEIDSVSPSRDPKSNKDPHL